MATGVMLKSQDLQKALEAGAIDYIRKPIDEIELLARTNSLLLLSDYHKQNIAIKNKELVENTMLLIKNNEFNIKFTKKLKELFNKLNTDNAEIIKIIEDILNQLEEKVCSDSWQRFELSFNDLNFTFNKNLLARFPDLTTTELKLCSFIKLGLCSKDIASILSQTADSIKVARYRLRKKLNLDYEQNLQTFLSKF